MQDVVIHIGLPKTATTFIQRLMSDKANYLGLEGYNAHYTIKLLYIYSDYSKGKSIREGVKRWSSSLTDFVQKNKLEGPVVISSEFFFAGELNGVPEFPLVENVRSDGSLLISKFLRTLSETLKYDFSIKVLLTIRNQPEWLASKYAQASPKIFGASQKDFENRMECFGKLSNKFWCNWGGVVKDLDEELGEKNVIVLCMEDIGENEFWRDLSFLFMGSEDQLKPVSKMTGNPIAVNKKRKSTTEWNLGQFQFGAHLAKKYQIVPGSHLHRFVVKLGNLLTRFGLGTDAGRDEMIYLSATAKYSCNNGCIEGNAWLEKRLNKDLSRLGYPKAIQ